VSIGVTFQNRVIPIVTAVKVYDFQLPKEVGVISGKVPQAFAAQSGKGT
jgi:hypothetical protein